MLMQQSSTHFSKPSQMPSVVPDMATYPTPPSSSGDSPQPVYFIASPNSSYFTAPVNIMQHNFVSADVVDLLSPNSENKPYLKFLEQPLNKFRFRYKSEMAGAHGSLCGIKSDRSRKQTYPTVELVNCNINAIIRCSIYQYNVEEDFKPHPHRLVMKRGREEQDDPHHIAVGPLEGYVAQFHSMGIIHTARKNIVSELVRKKKILKKEEIARMEDNVRELTQKELVEIKTLAEQESKTINLNIVCLRFDAFIEKNGIRMPICKPIFSHGINNLKCALTGDLKIVRMDHCTSPARGEKEVFLLVERVTKKNIKIRFFELDDDEQEVWEGWGKFSELDVHHQYAIVFKTPQFRDLNITQPVRVFMELVRPSDNARSEWKEFRYVPNNDFKPGVKRSRSNFYSSSSYNSSSFGSNDLPTTINNAFLPLNQQIQQQQIAGGTNVIATETSSVNSWNNGQILTDEQMNIAMCDVDSAEFQRLFNYFESELPEGIPSHVRDSPMDISKGIKNLNIRPRHALVLPPGQQPYRAAVSADQIQFLPDDILMADRSYNELKCYFKSKGANSRASEVLKKLLGTPHKTNALHVFIGLNRLDRVAFLLKIITNTNNYNFLEIRNTDGFTPLHIAVLMKNETVTAYLLRCRANPMTGDRMGRTGLHLAIETMSGPKLTELLLQVDQHEALVNSENYDGEAPLHTAVQGLNMMAVKLLCRFGAEINKKHQKNGYTPLRIAVDKQWCDGIEYILDHKDFDIDQQNDFNSISPFIVALTSSNVQMKEIINNYMTKTGNMLSFEQKDTEEEQSDSEEMQETFEVKKEPEDDSTNYSMDFEVRNIKSETEPCDLEELFKDINTLTSSCLAKVSTILDENGKYLHLADLLDITHLIQAGIISSEPSISRNLLTYAIEVDNVKILDIRNFLENLDEFDAVNLIDIMAKTLKAQ